MNTPWEIIAKHFSNESSSEEESTLTKWIEKSDENSILLKQLGELFSDNKQTREEYIPNTSDEWEKLKLRIEATEQEPKVTPFWKRRSLKVAASFLIILSLGYLFIDTGVKRIEIATTDNTEIFILPDNSKVQLNKNSKLSFPEKFDIDNREVKMSGEAYFEIERDEFKPFKVYTNNTLVTVLGTKFNINSYDSENIEVAVTSGKIQFETGENKILLAKGEKVSYNNTTDIILKNKFRKKDLRWWLKNIGKDVKSFIKNNKQ
ncbi:MAG: FecR domain-containing protein [Flavobacteriales bacterium]|nr:FecR domain-containing protein [Flavobacteriales bacterium]